MKRKQLAVIAVIIGIAFSSYTIKFNTVFYLVFTTGSQNSMGSFIITTVPQDPVLGDDVVAWVSIESADNQLDNGEFLAAFAALDESATQVNNLNDEDEKDRTFSYNNQSGLHAVLEKKAAQ